VEPPSLIKLSTSGGGSPGVPEDAVSDRLTHCHLSIRHGTRRRIGDRFSRFAPFDPLCSAQQGHL
jgi:phage terminase large subunit-like protein